MTAVPSHGRAEALPSNSNTPGGTRFCASEIPISEKLRSTSESHRTHFSKLVTKLYLVRTDRGHSRRAGPGSLPPVAAEVADRLLHIAIQLNGDLELRRMAITRACICDAERLSSRYEFLPWLASIHTDRVFECECVLGAAGSCRGRNPTAGISPAACFRTRTGRRARGGEARRGA